MADRFWVLRYFSTAGRPLYFGYSIGKAAFYTEDIKDAWRFDSKADADLTLGSFFGTKDTVYRPSPLAVNG